MRMRHILGSQLGLVRDTPWGFSWGGPLGFTGGGLWALSGGRRLLGFLHAVLGLLRLFMAVRLPGYMVRLTTVHRFNV